MRCMEAWQLLSRVWWLSLLVRVAGDLQEVRDRSKKKRRRIVMGIRYFANLIAVLLLSAA